MVIKVTDTLISQLPLPNTSNRAPSTEQSSGFFAASILVLYHHKAQQIQTRILSLGVLLSLTPFAAHSSQLSQISKRPAPSLQADHT